MADKSKQQLEAEAKQLKLLEDRNKNSERIVKVEKDLLKKSEEQKTAMKSLTDEVVGIGNNLLSGAESLTTSIFGGTLGGILNVLTTGMVKRKLANKKAEEKAAAEKEKQEKAANEARDKIHQQMMVQMRKDKQYADMTDRQLKIKILAAENAEKQNIAAVEGIEAEKKINTFLATKIEKYEKDGGEVESKPEPKTDTAAAGGAVDTGGATLADVVSTAAGGAVDTGGATLADVVSTLDFTNELLYDGLFGSPPLLKSVLENQETDLDNQESKEDRRERLRKSGGVAAAGGGGAGAAAGGAEGKGGILSSVQETLMTAVGLGAGGAAGGGTLSQIGKLGSKFKTMSKSIAGKIAGKVVGTALSTVTAVAMVGKDVFDIASAITDDDVRTGVKGADVGGVIGGLLGGVVGFALGGPAGAALGASLGNMAGEFLGEAFDSPEIVGAVQKVKDDLTTEKQTLATEIADINAQLTDTNTSEAMKALLREQLKQSTARQTAVGEELKVFAEGGDLDIANKAVIEAGKKGDALAAQKAKLKAQIEAADEKGDSAKVAYLTTILTQTEEDFDKAEAAYAIKAEELRKVAQKTSGALAESSTSLMDKLATEGGFFGSILSSVGAVSEFFGGGGIGLKGEAGGKYLEEQFKKIDGKIAEQEALIKSGDDFDWSLEPRTAIINKLMREKTRLEGVKEEKGLARGGFIVNKPTYLPSSGIVVGEHGTYSGRGAAAGGIADGGPEAVIPLSSSRSGAFIDPMARSVAGAVMNQLQMERGMMSGGGSDASVVTGNDMSNNQVSNNTTVINNPSPIGQTLPDEGRDFVSKVA
tara:strand:+ start:40 stop:2493 length:2454 start_codon:yes stop_codon:yes gene_type:complete